MPAEVDLLCEYYISSNLSNIKKQKTSPSNNTTTKIANGSFTVSQIKNQSQQKYDTIEFVKYDKNPLVLLKSKYKTLNNNVNTTNHEFQQSNNNKSSKIEIGITKSQEAHTTIISTSSNHSNLDLTWSKIRKTGIGLWNLGNTCYLNATLQCLAYTPPLSQWLVTKPHSNQCRLKHIKGFCSLCEVEKIIYEIFNSPNGCVRPNVLCSNIRKISNVFDVGAQEDASEFFTTLLESMAKSIRHSNGLTNNIINKSDLLNNNRKSKPNSIPTILDEIFSFQFRSRITCGNCGRLSDTIEKQNTWPIDVKYVQDIRKGMLHFLRQEVLEGENSYKCDKCNKKTRATKQYSFKTAPNILVVHLKRFDFSFAGKLSHFVQYPEILSLKSFVPESSPTHSHASSSAMSAALAAAAASLETSNSCKVSLDKELRNVNYKLYGVLVHFGHTSHSGHYYSYIRGPNDSWYKADDQRVSVVQSRDALSQNAYILFYNKMPNTIATNGLTSAEIKTKIQLSQSSESSLFKRPNLNSGSVNLMNQLQQKTNTNKISFQITNIINNRPTIISESNGTNHSTSEQTNTIQLKRKLIEETCEQNKSYSYNNGSNGLANRPKLISETNANVGSITSSNCSRSTLGTLISNGEKQEKALPVYGPQLPSKLISNGVSSNGYSNGHYHEASKLANRKLDDSEEKTDRKKSDIKSHKLKIKRLIKSLKSIKRINEKSVKTSKKLKKKKIKYLQGLLKDKKMLKACKDKSSEVFKRIKKLKKLVKKNKRCSTSSVESIVSLERKSAKMNGSSSSLNNHYEYNNGFKHFHKSSTTLQIAAVV